MQNKLLAIAASAHWFTETELKTCPKQLSDWLFDHNSLTQKLERLSNRFHVQVKQQVTTNSKNSTLSHYFCDEEKILVREVYLYCDGVAVVFAQTEIPYSSLTEEQAKLAEIGEQSLGKFLFQDPSMLRGQIEVCEFIEDSTAHKICEEIQQECKHTLWARRSLFYLNNKPLLVSELFLPALEIY